jgi:hypothetical protein
MKLWHKALIAGAAIIFLAGTIYLVSLLAPGFALIGFMHHQMVRGVNCMNSIKNSDFPYWINHTKYFLQSSTSNELHEIFEDIPKDLKDKGITRIDVEATTVRYVWLGGMDHTYLEVEKGDDGAFRFHANYNDKEPSKVIAEIKSS